MQLIQHCWNHEAREAACRCPSCGRTYCRECVSEHEGRLLCAACLAGVTGKRETRAGFADKLTPPTMLLAAILLAWLTYWVMGASVIGLVRRMQTLQPANVAGSQSLNTEGGLTGSAPVPQNA